MNSFDDGHSSLSSICSPLTSQGTPRSDGEEGRSRLLELLTRPRGGGGYGGHLSFTEFTAMVRPLRWSQEDVEDCWYDAVNGVAQPEVTNMPHVADVVSSYCYTSSAALADGTAPDAAMLLLLLPPLFKESPARRTAHGAGSHEAANGPEGRVPSHLLPPDGGVNSPKDTPESVSVPPPLSAAHALAFTDDAPTSSADSETARGAQPQSTQPCALSPPQSKQRRRSLLASVVQRYAAPTASSDSKRASTPHLRSPLRRPASPASQSERTGGSSVFERLYNASRNTSPAPRRTEPAAAAPETTAPAALVCAAHGSGTTAHGRRSLMLAAAHDTRSAGQSPSTFKPTITPYHSERFDRLRAERSDYYQKPTVAYINRLMGVEKHVDPLEVAPPTPRIPFRPAPGPSTHVPSGYVEGVARLRANTARRARESEFRNGLRGPPPMTVEQQEEERRLLDGTVTPILRLPIPADAEYEGRHCIDVRLATPARCRRRPTVVAATAARAPVRDSIHSPTVSSASEDDEPNEDFWRRGVAH